MKSVSFYLERFQGYGVLKNVQLFGPPCTIPCPKKCPTLSFAVTCLHQNGQNLAYKKRNSEIQNSSCFTFTYLILAINLICCYYVIHTSLQYLQTMTFSDEDKILIKSLHLSKGYNASRLLAEFPGKGWTKRSINRLFQKVRDTGRPTVDRCQPAKTASHRHLVKSVSGRHRRRNRPVASATMSMCEGEGTSFRVSAVANRLFSEPPPISNRLFSDPPKAFRRRHSAFTYT